MRSKKQLQKIVPYHPAMNTEDVKRVHGLKHVVKLASNENPYGCSHNVQKAITSEINRLFNYPENRANRLREKLANYIGVNQD